MYQCCLHSMFSKGTSGIGEEGTIRENALCTSTYNLLPKEYNPRAAEKNDTHTATSFAGDVAEIPASQCSKRL